MVKNLIIIAILFLVVGSAMTYIIRAKKRGVKCIGCPDGSKCKGCGISDTPCSCCDCNLQE